MASRIGELLVSSGLISTDQLEEALKAQLVFGGRLGTNLVELGYLSPQSLASLLGTQLHAPCAEPREFEQVSDKALRTLSGELAARYCVFPLELKGKHLRLAMTRPADLRVIDELTFRSGLTLEPVVAPEYLIVTAIEHWYGIARRRRYLTLEEDGANPPAQAVAGAGPLAGLSTQFGQQLLAAQRPDDVLEVLRVWLSGQFWRSAIFVVQDDTVHGWGQGGCVLSDEETRKLVFPLAHCFLLREGVGRGEPFSGRVDRLSTEGRALARLGMAGENPVLIAALTVAGETVGFVAGLDPRTTSAKECRGLLHQACTRAGYALEILRLRERILSPQAERVRT